jgi:uncharacterized protein (TIGR02646 family)
MPPVVRRQTPPVLSNYKKYKPYLRSDFARRCAYCHIPELRYGPPRNFTVDHFRPKSRFPKRACHYPNLFYACQDCNAFKGSAWPTRQSRLNGARFLDPCLDDFAAHVKVTDDGSILPITDAGDYMISQLQLDRPVLTVWRASKIHKLRRANELDAYLAGIQAERLWPESGDRHSAEIALLLRVACSLREDLAQEFGGLW